MEEKQNQFLLSQKIYWSQVQKLLQHHLEKLLKILIALSGGEQAFVAIAIYFAILTIKPVPFCILDEIDAALDEVNVRKYAVYLKKFTDIMYKQFIIVTHRRGTMEAANVLYGVTMQENGISKLLKMQQVDIPDEIMQ